MCPNSTVDTPETNPMTPLTVGKSGSGIGATNNLRVESQPVTLNGALQ